MKTSLNRIATGSHPGAAKLRPPRHVSARRGAALAEFAIVFPLLLLIFVFMIDFGRAYIVAKAIDNAIAQGAYRASTMSPGGLATAKWIAAIEQTVRQSLTDYPWYVPSRLTVTIPVPSNSNGLVDAQGNHMVEVQAEYRASHVMNLPGLPRDYIIDRTIRMDQIR